MQNEKLTNYIGVTKQTISGELLNGIESWKKEK